MWFEYNIRKKLISYLTNNVSLPFSNYQNGDVLRRRNIWECHLIQYISIVFDEAKGRGSVAVMALVRHPCAPSATPFPTAQPLRKSLHSILCFPTSFPSLYQPLRLRARTRTRLFHLSASAQTLEPPPPPLSSETGEEEESSRARLVAQNIPWTCTAQDIRALFQKHGTVLDVEVLRFSTFKLVPPLLFFSLPLPPVSDLGSGIVLFSCVC